MPLPAPHASEPERTTTATLESFIATARAFHSRSTLHTAVETADGASRVNIPCPSFKRTATGRLVHAVVTTTSRKLSPLTSRETICSPPEGAETPMGCPSPLL